MSGIRKAIYNHRTPDMESAECILNTAFAERRFMLDVFMTPKPLPCNQPTIPLSQLAMHTGHRSNSRIWIGVHGKVYDVTGMQNALSMPISLTRHRLHFYASRWHQYHQIKCWSGLLKVV
jgi:hypothetical protein